MGGGREGMRSGGCETVNGELHVPRTEIALKNRRDRTSDAAVRGGIFRMSWCARQRGPIGICDESRIAAASADGGDRPPETEGKFSVPAPDGGVRESGPPHGHQPRPIGRVKAPLCSQPPPTSPLLLPRVSHPI